jgi:16S rRNA pseudouridine516 synthase
MGKKVRLDKFLANAGIGSRKEVKKLIKERLVKVNDEIVKSPNIHIDPDKDRVYLVDEVIEPYREQYYMFNKPSGYITATQDKEYPVVMEFFEAEPYFDKLFPVGRLDIDTEGLLIITSDGQFAHRLSHPKWNIEKEYIAVVDGIFNIPEERLKKFEKEGIYLKKDKYQTKPFKIKVLEIDKKNKKSTVDITVSEGKYHIVKKILKELGYPVEKLKRVRIGNLKLDENLVASEYRKLSQEEINNLKKLINMDEVK